MRDGLGQYRLLLRLLAPAILGLNAWQALHARQLRLFQQRLGVGLPQRNDRPLWLHAASVGEILAARPLITGLHARFPQLPLVVTTTTSTGAEITIRHLPAEVQHVFLPVDWPGAVDRFLRALQPRGALIMETELWPNLFTAIARHDLPLVVVNGRLSPRTRNATSWVHRLYALSLQNVSAVLARSADDADAYIRLGVPADRVRTLGNIKFASAANMYIQAIDPGRPFVLAASTHDDEEQQIAHTWRQIDRRSRLLVIAPRHPRRREAILQQLAQTGLTVAVRSRGDAVKPDTDIYLADTLGELEGFMAGADSVFMGGSLVPRGGHNILEPARLGRPVLFGPHMANFADEAQWLLQAKGAEQVADAQALATTWANWLTQPATASRIGTRAREAMSAQATVLDDYLQAVTTLCGLAGASAKK
jgi:3-deoxy-D-manno-octulosonic-acid transferase